LKNIYYFFLFYLLYYFFFLNLFFLKNIYSCFLFYSVYYCFVLNLLYFHDNYYNRLYPNGICLVSSTVSNSKYWLSSLLSEVVFYFLINLFLLILFSGSTKIYFFFISTIYSFHYPNHYRNIIQYYLFHLLKYLIFILFIFFLGDIDYMISNLLFSCLF